MRRNRVAIGRELGAPVQKFRKRKGAVQRFFARKFWFVSESHGYFWKTGKYRRIIETIITIAITLQTALITPLVFLLNSIVGVIIT